MSADTNKKVMFSFFVDFPKECDERSKWGIFGVIEGWYYGVMSTIKDSDRNLSILSFYRGAQEELEYYVAKILRNFYPMTESTKVKFETFEQNVEEEDDCYRFRINIVIRINNLPQHVNRKELSMDSSQRRGNHMFS